MDKEQESPSAAVTLDQVLKKYGKIWIWSILMTFSAAEFMRTLGGVNVLTYNIRNGQIGALPAKRPSVAFTEGLSVSPVSCPSSGCSNSW